MITNKDLSVDLVMHMNNFKHAYCDQIANNALSILLIFTETFAVEFFKSIITMMIT